MADWEWLREYAEKRGAKTFFAVIYSYDENEEEERFTDFEITLDQMIEIGKTSG